MADITALRARNVDFWAQTAPGWIRHADRHDDLGRPLGAARCEWLRPAPGERILDVGCGCGGTTADLAAAVGRAATAVGLDLAPAMVDAGRERRFPRRAVRRRRHRDRRRSPGCAVRRGLLAHDA